MIIFNILRLMFDPIGLIYRPKMTYIGLEYHELFDNYIAITGLIWGIFIIYFCVNYYKKSVKSGN